LLDVSRIVSGKLTLDFETTDIASVVAAAADLPAPRLGVPAQRFRR